MSFLFFLVIWQKIIAGFCLRYDRTAQFTFQLVSGSFCHATAFFGYLSLLFVALGSERKGG